MPAAGHRQTEPAARTDISRALPAIFAAGLLCGVMDISAAFLLTWFPAHYPPKRLLQGIASGLLGSGLFSTRLGHSRAWPRFPFPDCLYGGHSLLCRQSEASVIDRPSLARRCRICACGLWLHVLVRHAALTASPPPCHPVWFDDCNRHPHHLCRAADLAHGASFHTALADLTWMRSRCDIPLWRCRAAA